MKKAVIFAPFWRQAGHVGNNRVARFVRWLATDGYHVVMIRAGSTDSTRVESWGIEISVRDSSGYYHDQTQNDSPVLKSKKNILRRALLFWLPRKFRYAIVSWIFNPDPSIVWARSAASHPAVLDQVAGAAFILSSSPPESAHVGAWRLAKKMGLAHIVDMRDGWLDEPLKPLLRRSALRRWQEGRLEEAILKNAKAIMVTSEIWLQLLSERLPDTFKKTTILTNGYPQIFLKPEGRKSGVVPKRLNLIHAGRFSGSDSRRTPDKLLAPILASLNQCRTNGLISLFGQLTDTELHAVNQYSSLFSGHDWQIECPGIVPHEEMQAHICNADGLLLISTSYAAIPSKLFEYIVTRRPMLVLTERNSATWRVCEKLPQAFLVELGGRDDTTIVNTFLDASTKFDNEASCPSEYTEMYLSNLFHQSVNNVCSGKKA